ncbi:hypothetical protein [Pseudalkalibacillus berkeleyi]|uniref:Tissue inhibitor of metalloproteinase n=1 Tax=Pseudalkalibacillus berkeleyi TaxID=1069813 RepID=A0ABS9GY32_9BACL|nr:hypothetical protein [Pseudalkalibacillus berkeleyi]MCF6136403.1 hypothetical protein [Pseudalkalibacillus berkeleyi]
MKWTGRIAISLIMLLGVSFLNAPTPAQACSCAVPSSPDEEMKRSDAVFMGTVKDIKDKSFLRYSPKKVVFEVSKSWKGEIKEEITILTGTNSANCGFPFEEGEKYIVYAMKPNMYGGNRHLTATLCSLTSNLNPDKEGLLKPHSNVIPSGDWKVPTQETEQNHTLLYTSIWAAFTAISGLILWKMVK